MAILKVLRSKAEQQQQQQATAKADQQKTKANQHSTTVDGLSFDALVQEGIQPSFGQPVDWAIAAQRRWHLHLVLQR